MQSAQIHILHRNMIRRVAVGALAIAVAGCAVGPNYHRPADTPVAKDVSDRSLHWPGSPLNSVPRC